MGTVKSENVPGLLIAPLAGPVGAGHNRADPCEWHAGAVVSIFPPTVGSSYG